MAGGLSRRTFVKLSAAGAPAGLMLDWRLAAAESGGVDARSMGHDRWNNQAGEATATGRPRRRKVVWSPDLTPSAAARR